MSCSRYCKYSHAESIRIEGHNSLFKEPYLKYIISTKIEVAGDVGQMCAQCGFGEALYMLGQKPTNEI